MSPRFSHLNIHNCRNTCFPAISLNPQLLQFADIGWEVRPAAANDAIGMLERVGFAYVGMENPAAYFFQSFRRFPGNAKVANIYIREQIRQVDCFQHFHHFIQIC